MDSARWVKIQEIFHQATERPAGERAAFVRSACGGDASLIGQIMAMLTEDDSGGSLLDRDLPEIAFAMVGSYTDSPPLQEIGPYRLKHLLGEGGMGVVWLAERADMGNLVAIKFLPHAGLSPARRERFLHETWTLARLTHPNIARLYDAGTLDDGTPWFAMEYVKGISLAGFLEAHRLSLDEKLKLFRKICEAVQYAHGQAIIHRDLKPTNILVEEDGTPKLLDFGIAKQLQQLDTGGGLTRPELRFMTRAYAPPEWVRDGLTDVTTDVYSLGVILYEMLTGRLPFPDGAGEGGGEAERPSSVAGGRISADGIKSVDAISKSAWRDLDEMCLKAMRRDGQQRYATVEALIRDIDHFLKGQPLEARPPALSYKVSKFVGRNRRAVLAASLTVLLVVGLTVAFTLRLARARDAALTEAARTRRIQQFMLYLLGGSDTQAAPASDLRVVTLLDHGVLEAQALNKEPAAQADLFQTLGTMYQRLGKLDKADALRQAGLKLREALPGASFSTIAENRIALALLRSDQGRFQEAEALAREVLAAVQTKEAGNKPLVAKAESALGHVLVEGGKYAQGAEILSQALSIESNGSQSSPEYAGTLTSLADAQMYLGHYGDCERLNLRALAINRQIYGENHPTVSDNLRNLGQLHEKGEQYAEAEAYESQALKMNRAWYGAEHPQTAEAMTTLADTLVHEGKYAEAEGLSQQAVAIQRKVYGNDHSRVAFALNALGSLELELHDYAKAEDADRQAIETYRRALGDGDYRVAVAMGNLASVYSAEKAYAKCETLLKEVVQRLSKTLPADNFNTGESEVRLGRTLLHEKKYAEAEQHSRAGYESLMKQGVPPLSFVQGARQDLAIVYDALGKPQEAQRFREELASGSGKDSKVVASK